jgi:ribonuclease HII
MFPSQVAEAALLEQHGLVIGIDEVGRGALAGPVSVGACVVDNARLGNAPAGVQDSKLVAESKRADLANVIRAWAAVAVGHASVFEIEQLGIARALRLAGERAVAALEVDLTAAVVLLDGSSNWMGKDSAVPVVTQVKADRDCTVVAAASLAAKVERDQLLVQLAQGDDRYGWQRNKGYSSAEHIRALQNYGPSEHHRLSWLSKILADQTQLF